VHFSIPSELTDIRARGHLLLLRGDQFDYRQMMLKVEEIKDEFLVQHPETAGREGFRFEGSDLVLASDGTPRPAYDVKVLWSHPRSDDELARLEEERRQWVERREADYHRREKEQQSLLKEVLEDLERRKHW
jgi:hypothetical protein